VRIHGIRKMNLSYSENRRLNQFVYLECAKRIYMYTEYTGNSLKGEYLGKFETKIENILGRLSGLRWVRFAKPLKTKKIIQMYPLNYRMFHVHPSFICFHVRVCSFSFLSSTPMIWLCVRLCVLWNGKNNSLLSLPY
jgi:hypothetical protein